MLNDSNILCFQIETLMAFRVVKYGSFNHIYELKTKTKEKPFV